MSNNPYDPNAQNTQNTQNAQSTPNAQNTQNTTYTQNATYTQQPYQQQVYGQAPNNGYYQNQQPYQQPYQQPNPAPASDDYKPISMWGYFGYELLFAIPIVGLILAIVWSFGASNRNVKNFARSQFCWMIIICIIWLILLATGALAGVMGNLR